MAAELSAQLLTCQLCWREKTFALRGVGALQMDLSCINREQIVDERAICLRIFVVFFKRFNFC